MNYTPEVEKHVCTRKHVDASFACQLEAERNKLRYERDDLREALIQILENCYDDVDIYSSDELAAIYSEIANIARKALKS